MITGRVKAQLILFVVITLLGVTYVGAKYAQLDRLFGANGYSVTVEMADAVTARSSNSARATRSRVPWSVRSQARRRGARWSLGEACR